MLRFTIRDLLWLMVVVALAVGWWVDHKPISRENMEAIRNMKENGYELSPHGKTLTFRKVK